MTDTIIHLDIASLLILAIILISQLSRKMYKGSTNIFFIALIILTFLSSCMDIWAALLDNIGYPDAGVRILSHSLFLMFYNSIPPFFLMYVLSLSCAWAKVTSHKITQILLIIPYLASIGLIIVNIFTGFIFSIEDGIYRVNSLSFLLFLMAGIYIVAYTAYIIRYRKLFTFRKILAMFLMIPITALIVAVRLIYPNTLVMVFANTMCLSLISILIQRPENTIDSITGLNIYNAYADDMKKNYMINNRTAVIMVNTANYDSLYKMLGYDKMMELLQKIARRILDQNGAAKCYGTAYYLDRGHFRLVVNSFFLDSADKAAELINDALRKPVKIGKYDLNLIPYVCLVKCPEDITTFPSLMSFGADFHTRLPYNGEVIRADQSTIKRMMSLLTDVDGIIDRALANHGFHVYYQPIYSVEKKRFISAEALLRLTDEKGGFISPEIFIPAAEKSGAIHKIGDFVLDEVCRFIASDEYRSLGMEYIEINLSVSQCMRHGLSKRILDVMNKYGVSPDQVNLEITETAASYDQSVMSENLADLSAAGLSFSLDDYGTGYSNMYRIAALPLKIVKLDKTFVNNQTGKMWTILRNTIRMIKDLNMEIVVEGIETEEMLKKFSDLRCDFIQGFYFSKPIPQEDFVKFIQKHN